MSNKNVNSWFDFGKPSKTKNFFIIIFVALYFVIWLPLPFIFPWRTYVPGPLGIPAFVWFLVLMQIIIGIVFLVMMFSRKARALYEDEEEDG